MTSALWVIALIAAVAAFFTWANSRTKKEHAAFHAEDVIAAIESVLSTTETHDAFDMFLSWPIDDRRLEAIRQRCIAICRDDPGERGKDISTAGEAKLRLILKELAVPGGNDAGR